MPAAKARLSESIPMKSEAFLDTSQEEGSEHPNQFLWNYIPAHRRSLYPPAGVAQHPERQTVYLPGRPPGDILLTVTCMPSTGL